MATLDSKLIGILDGRMTKALDKAFGYQTVGELLAHHPRRLAERGHLTELSQLQLGEEVTVVADVLTCKVLRSTGGVRLEVVVGDGTSAKLQLVFFGPKATWREKELKPGVRGLFSGKVGDFRGKRQLVHPEYMLLRDDGFDELEADVYANQLIPIYPATQSLRTWTIARAVALVLHALDPVVDPLEFELLARHSLMTADEAIRAIHEPDDYAQWFAAKKRFAWDEALGVQLALAQRRREAAHNPAVPRPIAAGGLLAAFDAQLPFTLTKGQREVGGTITAELSLPHPMHRLLQGEVGSGKTVVALRAMLQTVDAGGQAALLAPTEVLAAQHARTIESMLGPLALGGQLGGTHNATRIALVTGSLGAAARRAALLDVASGAAGIVIGTHALIQEHVSFAELGLVVVDEQHRFGVEQRDALRSKATKPPHVLVMTATPIPRTVAMTVFGDLETSTLAELPAGRTPITTSVVPAAEKPNWLERTWQRIREEVAAGRQAYVVCPRVGTDDQLSDDAGNEDFLELDDEGRRPPLAINDVFPMLTQGPLKGLRVAMLHGRLPPDEKDRTMTEFAAGRTDVLVATTVIEVGVDVPNATVMTVLDADRFGVSQLHQLRGRVGRGGHPGLCLLVTDLPEGSLSRDRLDAVAASTDGFILARRDLEQRREGDVLGAAQSGRRRTLRHLSLLRDEDLITAARAEATDIVAADPTLEKHPQLAAQVAALVDDEHAEYLEKG